MEQLVPTDHPVDCAREWLDAYEFRLIEADRCRHYKDVMRESYRKALASADDPNRDRLSEALPILLDRIRSHLHPPYSPEVLLVEYQALQDIPIDARLRQRFVGRMYAWVDRVETFLGIGARSGAPDEASNVGEGIADWRSARWFHKATRGMVYADLLRSARKDGRLTADRIGGRWYYRPSDVNRLWPEYAQRVQKAYESV